MSIASALFTLTVSVGLAMDAFAVSLGIGAANPPPAPRAIFRLSFHFGFFQGGMTLLGWLAGSTIVTFISTFDHWVAFALLAFVGGRMIHSGFNPDLDTNRCNDPSRGGTLVLLCVATSIDALAVGLSLGMVGADVLLTSIGIAVITSALSLFGLLTGKFFGMRFGKRMEIFGGLVLLAIGFNILYTHLF